MKKLLLTTMICLCCNSLNADHENVWNPKFDRLGYYLMVCKEEARLKLLKAERELNYQDEIWYSSEIYAYDKIIDFLEQDF